MIEEIDAPFNILGAPIYQDYYVTHSWEWTGGKLYFSPLADSAEYAKPEIKSNPSKAKNLILVNIDEGWTFSKPSRPISWWILWLLLIIIGFFIEILV